MHNAGLTRMTSQAFEHTGYDFKQSARRGVPSANQHGRSFAGLAENFKFDLCGHCPAFHALDAQPILNGSPIEAAPIVHHGQTRLLPADGKLNCQRVASAMLDGITDRFLADSEECIRDRKRKGQVRAAE